jgi:phasin
MAESENPSDVVRSMMAKNLEQARGAMTNYFQFLEKSMSTSPLGATDQAKTFKGYVERNVAASFEFSDKLLHAKDFQDILRIQTEFFQTQLRALTEQGKEVGDTAAKPASEVINVPIK